MASTPVHYFRHGSAVAHSAHDLLDESVDETDEMDTLDHVDGLLIHTQVVTDDFMDEKECLADGSLKPMRPLPHVRAGEFFQQLQKAEDGRWLWAGPLNAWPALVDLELLSVTCKTKGAMGRKKIVRCWDSPLRSARVSDALEELEREERGDEKGGKLAKIDARHRERRRAAANKLRQRGDLASDGAQAPSFPRELNGSVRVTMRLPSWSKSGWAEDSPGFAWWYLGQAAVPSLVYGTDMKAHARNAVAVRAHHFGHRYAKMKESTKDHLTYHAGVLVEWDHGEHATVFELAWRHGIGGYGGQSNWMHDKTSGNPVLNQVMPGELKRPWECNRSEIRALDVPAKNRQEFAAYLEQYTGKTARFLEPGFRESEDVRLTLRSQENIMTYLLNYISSERATVYAEKGRNCQTFAADFMRLLCGPNSKIEPYHKPMRALYSPHPELFLYDS